MNTPPYFFTMIVHRLEVLRVRRDEAAHALDGLGQEAGDLPGGGGLDDVLDVLGALEVAALGLLAEGAAVAVRGGRVLHARDLARHRAIRAVRGERLREHRPPAVAELQRDELGAAGGRLSQRHRGLVGLGAGGAEEHLSSLPGVSCTSFSASSTIGSVGYSVDTWRADRPAR
jgi:hypothetical protein